MVRRRGGDRQENVSAGIFWVSMMSGPHEEEYDFDFEEDDDDE